MLNAPATPLCLLAQKENWKNLVYFTATKYPLTTYLWLYNTGLLRSSRYVPLETIADKVQFIEKVHYLGELEYVIDDYPFYGKYLTEEIVRDKLILVDYLYNKKSKCKGRIYFDAT